MRKSIVLTLLMACIAMSGRAQGTSSYFTLCDDAISASSGMTVKAILDLSDDDIWWGETYGRYQVAAFVEGECHAIAMEGDSENMTYWTERDQYGNWFVLNLKYSSARRSKDIVFKLYNNDTGLEYNLTCDTNIRTIGVSYGTDDNPIVLKAVEPYSMSFNDFEMTVGNMQDLSAKLTFSPSNATCPNNLEFEIDPSTYKLNVTGNGGYQFTPSAAGTYEISHREHGLQFREGTITVKRATNYVSSLSINEGYETIEVNRGDNATLGDMLNWALNVKYYYNYEPDEYPVWESSNTSVVSQDESGIWMPVGKGTCTMTAKVYHPVTGAVRLSASLTVKVTNDAQSLELLHGSLRCYVDDDLTDYLPRTVQTVPADADTPDWFYEINSGEGVLEERDGRIVAVGEGSCSVNIYAISGVYETIRVTVQNAYTGISIKQPELNIKYTGNGSAQDISSTVNGNVSYLPASASYFAGYGPTISSSNTDVVSVEMESSATGTGTDIKATAYGKGRATITVNLESPNLLEESVSAVGTSVDPIVVSKSFDVVLSVDLTGIAFTGREYNLNVGDTQDFSDQIEAYPSGADLDLSKVVLSVPTEYKDNVSIDGLKVTALLPAPDGFYLTATVPDASPSGSDITAETPIYIYSPATAIKVNDGYDPIEVYVGDGETLTEKLKNAIKLEPANTTDYFIWEFEDETIVKYDGDKKQYMPLKYGETKATAMVYTNRSMKTSLTIKVQLKAEELKFSKRDYAMNVGDTTDFREELSVYPADAVFDWSKVVLSVPNDYKDYVKIEGLKVTALLPYTKGFTLTATVPDASPSGSGTLTAETDLFIYSPATAINVNSGYETIEVYVGEDAKLTELLGKAVTIEPANTTDYYYWEFADADIIKYDSDKNLYQALKGGTTKATAIVSSNSSLKAELTIKVLVKAGSISFSKRDYAMNVGETTDFRDELSVYPADAVFDWSKVVLSVPNDYKDYVKIEGLKVTALLPYTKGFTLTATVPDASPSGSGTDITAETDLFIYSPATAINVNSGYETIEVYVGETTKLSEAIGKAFSLVPANSTSSYYYEVEDKDIVSYDEANATFTPLKGGTTKITAIVSGNSSLRATLTVKVHPDAEKLILPEQLIVKMGETIDLTTVLKWEPAEAELDFSAVQWSYSNLAKEYFTVENNILTPLKTVMIGFSLTATINIHGNELTTETNVYVSNPATGLSVCEGYEKISVHVYEDEVLSQKIKEAFVVTPDGSTDKLVVTIDNDEVVSADGFREGNYIALRPGTATLTANIYDYFDTEHTKPLFPAVKITVEVLPAVESITLPETVEINEGETLNLDDIVTLNLYPNQNYHPANLIWTIEKGKEKLVSIDDDHVLTAITKGTLTLTATVPYTDIKASTTLTILRPATELSIVSGFETVYVCVGSKRLPAILEDGLFSLPLGHTDKVEWLVADDGILEVADDGILTPVKAGTTKVRAYIGDKANPRLQTADWTVEVGLQITAVTAKEPLLTLTNDVFSQRSPITQTIKDNFELTPETRLIDYNPRFVSTNEGSVTVNDYGTPDEDGVRPMGFGSTGGRTTITVTITVPDYNNPSSRNGKPKTKQLQGSFDIEVEMGLQGIDFDYIDMVMGEEYELKLRTVPENAKFDFDASKFEISIEHQDGRDFPYDWDFVSWRPSGNDPLTFILDTKSVGKGYVSVIYDGVVIGGGGAPRLSARPRYTVGNGWQWLAICDGTLKDQYAIKNVFGNNLVEVRSRNALLVNDPEIGYIGDLEQIASDVTYKLNLKDLPDAGLSFDIPSDEISIFTGKTIDAIQYWNWMGNPYQYYQPISDIFAGTDFFTDDQVATKDAFATWDGFKWVGSLKYVTPGEGILLFTRYDNKVKLNSETDMKQNLTMPATARSTSPLPAELSSLASASRRHADHMNMIATVEGLNSQENCILLAFVGDECRGRSVIDADRHFITVHGDTGEPVHFVVFDTQTGLYHAVEGQIDLAEQRGTLSEPVRLLAGKTQSVLSVALSSQHTEKTYDLQGRRVDNSQLTVHSSQLSKGVYIRDGKKVVKR